MRRKSSQVNKAVYAGCAVGVLAASAGILYGAASSRKTFMRLDKSDFLKTDGNQMKNTRGEPVVLRGVTLGGWLLQESRLSPNNNTLALLAERFGEEKAGELMNTYLDNWITANDLDRLKKLGVNCVRVPFTCRNFLSNDNSTRRKNNDSVIDFSRLDWMVAQCGKRGIYVIPDMYAAPGFQSSDPSCGKAKANELFDCSLAGLKYRQRTAELWQALAKHFKGNPAIAAFGLLHAPMNGYPEEDINGCSLWHLTNKLYKAVRAEDPNRMIIIQSSRDRESLSNPKHFCWHNIGYRLPVNHWTAPEIDLAITELIAHANRKAPVFIGELPAKNVRDYPLSAFNEYEVNWLFFTYKGVRTQESDCYLYTADIETANLQEDSFEDIKAKWGKPCRTSKSFAENTELAAMLKRYLNGAVQAIEDIPDSAEPDMKVEVYDSADHIPNEGDKNSADPVKFVYGSVKLVGMGTLAELTKK